LPACLCLACQDRPWRVGDPQPPNILLVVVDTLRADHLGAYGYPRSTSPALDRLAAEAALFERAYSHSPWTMPSVASLLTGLTPRDHGITKWQDPLSPQLLSLAEALQDKGYRTQAAVSHIVLGERYGFDQGFDSYDAALLGRGEPHRRTSAPHITQVGLRALQAPIQEPFFLFLHYFDPHWTYQRHQEHDFGQEPVDRYDSEIAFTDFHLGRLLAQLEAQELDRRSIVALIGDHGEEFGDHGGSQHSSTLFDELLRVPLILRVPGFAPQRVEQVVAETQLAPTLLALAGLPQAFAAAPIAFDQGGFTPQQDQLVFAETLRGADQRAVIQGDWKLIHDRQRDRHELYHLAADPGERRDERLRRAERLPELQRLLDEHYAVPRAQVGRAPPLSEQTVRSLQALGYLDASPTPEAEP